MTFSTFPNHVLRGTLYADMTSNVTFTPASDWAASGKFRLVATVSPPRTCDPWFAFTWKTQIEMEKTDWTASDHDRSDWSHTSQAGINGVVTSSAACMRVEVRLGYTELRRGRDNTRPTCNRSESDVRACWRLMRARTIPPSVCDLLATELRSMGPCMFETPLQPNRPVCIIFGELHKSHCQIV